MKKNAVLLLKSSRTTLIHILVMTSRIRRQKGIEDQQTFERVLNDLVQAHKLATQYGRLDFVSSTILCCKNTCFYATASRRSLFRPILAAFPLRSSLRNLSMLRLL